MYDVSEFVQTTQFKQNFYQWRNRQIANERFEAAAPYLISAIVCAFFIMMIYKCIRFIIHHRRAKRTGVLQFTPIIPFPQDTFYISYSPTNTLINAKIWCSDTYFPTQNPGTSLPAIQEVNKILTESFKLSQNFTIPNNSRIISIRMQNFLHGVTCNHFEPVVRRRLGSSFTYEMFENNQIQVTRYKENGVSYVAGFCIYIENPTKTGYPAHLIKKLLRSSPYPGRRRTEEISSLSYSHIPVRQWTPSRAHSVNSFNYQSEEDFTVRYCPRLKKNIMSNMKSGVVVHREWNTIMNKMNKEECQICTERMNNDQPPRYSSLSMI